MRFILALGLVAATAGCGSSSAGGPTGARTARAPTTSSVAPTGPACSRLARLVLAGRTADRSVDVAAFTASNGGDKCRLRAGDTTVNVILDSAPQAYRRLENQVVEYGQNVDWARVPRSAYPRTVKHVGLDADWFPLENRLLTTDGVRMIDIKVRAREPSPQARESLAISLARVYLGPLRKPPGY